MTQIVVEFYSQREAAEFFEEMQARFFLKGHVARVASGHDYHEPDECLDYVEAPCDHDLEPECPECGATVWL